MLDEADLRNGAIELERLLTRLRLPLTLLRLPLTMLRVCRVRMTTFTAR